MTKVTGKKKVAKKKATRRKSTKQESENMTDESESLFYDYGEPETTRKLTNKVVMGKDFLDDKPTEPTRLYTLMGIIYGYTVGNTEYGQFIKFRGDFEAYNHVNETAFRAPSCIIPVPMDDVLATQYDQAVKEMADPETGELPKNKKAECQFAVDIGYKPSDTPTGYEWTVKSRVKMRENDAMLALKRQVFALDRDQGDEE